MIKQDYIAGGVRYFPLSKENSHGIKVLFWLSLPLVAISIAFFFSSDLGWLYIMVAAVLGILMIYANSRLIITRASYEAWRVYKLSAFPYLGLLFLAMSLDSWLIK